MFLVHFAAFKNDFRNYKENYNKNKNNKNTTISLYSCIIASIDAISLKRASISNCFLKIQSARNL
jgi:hypothetical protein